MAFEIDFTQPLSSEIPRVLAERIDGAADTLEAGAEGSPDEAVHTARKRLKEARAVLRLARDPLGRKRWRRANRALRDAARPLSEVRDAHVLVETLDKLVEHYRGEIEDGAFAPLRTELLARRDVVRGEVQGEGEVFRDVARRAREVREAIADWPALPDRFRLIRGGLERIYRQGRRAMTRALARGRDEDRHEWRKRGKDWRYVLEVLSPIRMEVLEPMAQQAHELTDLLGDDHDLAVLAELAEGDLRGALDDAARERLLAIARRRRGELMQSAADLGGRLYADPAGVLAQRIREWWRAQRRDIVEEQAGEAPAANAH